LVKGYIRGENVEGYKKLLLKTDFNIVEAVLGLKLETTKKEKNITTIVNGDPLTSFTKALLWILSEAKANDVDIATVKFEFNFAEVISMYSEMEDEEEEQQLLKTWQVICRHVNGLIEYLNRAAWNLYGNEVEIISGPSDFFDPQKAKKYIEDGLIKAASSNKTINKILFHLVCLNSQGEIVQEQFSCEREKDFVREFQWRFINSCSWLHNFSDICENDIELNKSYIPIAILPKIKSLMFAKSEEEFFDLYDESDIDFKFNLIDLINAKKTEVPEIIAAEFNDLGTKFTKFILEVTNEGFYKCILKDNSELIVFVEAYRKLGKMLTGQTWPENVKWILDAYIHAFNIENSEKIATGSEDSRCCIVPAWHPAALEKLNDQNLFILDGSKEWWNSEENDDIQIISGKRIEEVVNDLSQMSMIQSALDIFPSYGQVYFGAVNSFGAFSTYGRDDIENNSRLKDMIHKDAIYDDDFDSKENVEMNDNAKMIYDVIEDYNKAFPDSYRNLSVVFVNPSELQPIIAAIYKYIDVVRKKNPDKQMNINIKILVKPENKGGRNYLAYWMDECFSQDSNVNIHTYLNEWRNNNELDKILNGNNDIVFAMNLLKVNCYGFVQENGNIKFDLSQCRFPIVFKPAPISDTSSKVKRRIELSQPQFRASYTHTQVTRYRNNGEVKPISNYIAVREVCIDDEEKNTVSMLHEKAYWVVCVDSGMDGALLRNDDGHKDDYSIIGFSTGKGAYGQYNLTITARKIILETIKKKLSRRLYQLFMWDTEKIKLAASICIKEASGLDGISLFSAINQKDRNINEFMAYVLTSLREKEAGTQAALKIVVHLDSYKHWFSGEIDKDDDNSMSRPDFLVLEAIPSEENMIRLKATVIECKIASLLNATGHKEKAVGQVQHGIKRLSTIFDPDSSSIKRRYWYAQLYRALAFAQVTFSDNSEDFSELSGKLRSILDGNFKITWSGKVLGFWVDMDGTADVETPTEDEHISIIDIPQKRIQELLLKEKTCNDIEFVQVNPQLLEKGDDEEDIARREKEIEAEVNFDENKSNRSEQVIPSHLTDKGKLDDTAFQHQLNGNVAESGSNTNTNLKTKDNEDEMSFETGDKTQEKTLDTLPDIKNSRVLIGMDRVSQKVYWEFGHPQMANRHLLITGTSGQGKTYSIQTMLYELSKSNISSVVFDYTEGFRQDQLEKEFVEVMGNRISQHIVKMQGVPIDPFKQHEIDMAGMKMLEPASDVAARFANILIHVYGFGDQQFSAIYEATRIGIEKHGASMNMQYFQEELEHQKIVNKSAQTVLSKMAPFFHSISFNKDADFDWGEILYSKNAVMKIFQLTLIDREMQVIITELMLWDAWYYTKKVGSKDKPFVVVLDEAQNLSHKENSPSAAILTEGRKFGWSAWFATQSLKVLADEEVVRLMQAAFKLYFKPTDDEIVKIAKQLDPTDGNTWLTPLKALKKGQCIVVGERIRADGKFGLVKPTITNVTSFKERNDV